MKRLMIALFAALVGFGLMAPDADAKRLGGGSSVGMKRSATPTPSTPTASKSAASAPTAAASAVPAKPSGMSRFLGPLAGLAAGLGIAALLSHFGMGEGMANMLLILALVGATFFIVRWFMRRNQPEAGLQYAGASPVAAPPIQFKHSGNASSDETTGAISAPAAPPNIPNGFDVEGFLRQSKLSFIRLQASNDRGDMSDIREFTTPEVFAEIKMQHEGRKGQAQETDVMQLKSELLEVVTEGDRQIASVHFSGQIREDANAPATDFAETWHLTRPLDGSRGWIVGGIQQM